MPSFDIVSKVDQQEVDNAVNQAKKEIQQRYDFKDSKSEINFENKDEIKLLGDDEYKLKTVVDILQGKIIKRGISLKSLDYGPVEDGSAGTKRQVVKLKQGIDQDTAKKINKIIKDMKNKVQSQIQGDQLRVTGKKRDDLQAVIQELKAKDLDTPLQFVNMRD